MTAIACYNFNNALEGATVYDDSPGAHDGAVVGSVPLLDGPVSAKKRYFNGSTANRVEIPHDADFDISVPFSVETWNDVQDFGNHRVIISKGDFGLSSSFQLQYPSGSGYIDCTLSDNSGNYSVYRYLVTQPVNVLQYIVVVWTGSTALLYLNGAAVAVSVSHVGGGYSGVQNTGPIVFSSIYSSGGVYNPFIGHIHALCWHNAILTPKHIYDTYNGTNIQETLP